jgi:hypothetical protein
MLVLSILLTGDDSSSADGDSVVRFCAHVPICCVLFLRLSPGDGRLLCRDGSGGCKFPELSVHADDLSGGFCVAGRKSSGAVNIDLGLVIEDLCPLASKVEMERSEVSFASRAE